MDVGAGRVELGCEIGIRRGGLRLVQEGDGEAPGPAGDRFGLANRAQVTNPSLCSVQ